MKKIKHFHLAVPIQMFIDPAIFYNSMLNLDLPWLWIDINLAIDDETINHYRSNKYDFVSLDCI